MSRYTFLLEGFIIFVIHDAPACFQSLLSHKYGYRAFPRVIEAGEFEKIQENIDDVSTKELFKK